MRDHCPCFRFAKESVDRTEERLAAAGDESDLEEIFNTERHLLYVACTRARDFLLVTAAGEASEFLQDLKEFPDSEGSAVERRSKT